MQLCESIPNIPVIRTQWTRLRDQSEEYWYRCCTCLVRNSASLEKVKPNLQITCCISPSVFRGIKPRAQGTSPSAARIARIIDARRPSTTTPPVLTPRIQQLAKATSSYSQLSLQVITMSATMTSRIPPSYLANTCLALSAFIIANNTNILLNPRNGLKLLGFPSKHERKQLISQKNIGHI